MKHERLRHHLKKLIYTDERTAEVGLLVRLRLPWLIVGLLVGTLITLLISNYEHVLAEQVQLAFFIPVIVYLSGAVSTQTETIYVRNLSLGKAPFGVYLFKEFILGIIIGTITGALLGLFAYFWLDSTAIGLTVGLATAVSLVSATSIAVLVPTVLSKLGKSDPALGAGPFTTVLQDFISLLIYFSVASAIILN